MNLSPVIPGIKLNKASAIARGLYFFFNWSETLRGSFFDNKPSQAESVVPGFLAHRLAEALIPQEFDGSDDILCGVLCPHIYRLPQGMFSEPKDLI